MEGDLRQHRSGDGSRSDQAGQFSDRERFPLKSRSQTAAVTTVRFRRTVIPSSGHCILDRRCHANLDAQHRPQRGQSITARRPVFGRRSRCEARGARLGRTIRRASANPGDASGQRKHGSGIVAENAATFDRTVHRQFDPARRSRTHQRWRFSLGRCVALRSLAPSTNKMKWSCVWSITSFIGR